MLDLEAIAKALGPEWRVDPSLGAFALIGPNGATLVVNEAVRNRPTTIEVTGVYCKPNGVPTPIVTPELRIAIGLESVAEDAVATTIAREICRRLLPDLYPRCLELGAIEAGSRARQLAETALVAELMTLGQAGPVDRLVPMRDRTAKIVRGSFRVRAPNSVTLTVDVTADEARWILRGLSTPGVRYSFCDLCHGTTTDGTAICRACAAPQI